MRRGDFNFFFAVVFILILLFVVENADFVTCSWLMLSDLITLDVSVKDVSNGSS
jgi:hypothetical protein